jgi:hypothetical protein
MCKLYVIIQQQQRQNQSPRSTGGYGGIRRRGGGASGRRGGGGGRPFTGGISQHLASNNPRSSRGRGSARRGSRIPSLMSPLVNLQSTSSRRYARGSIGGGHINIAQRTTTNRRAVLKLAKKRVQKARLQLANKRAPKIGLTNSRQQSHVRVGRNGLFIVRDPVEKKLQQLLIRQKIQRAQAARARTTSAITTNNSRSAFQVRAPFNLNNRRQPTNNNNIRRQQQQQQQARPRPLMMEEEYDPYEPDLMRSVAPRQEQVRGGRGPPAGRGRGRMYSDYEGTTSSGMWTRTTRNEHAMIANDSIAVGGPDYDLMNSSLNPEIQRKISFIQTRNRSSGGGEAPPGIIPDFRAPIVSSSMKLGDRFRMYMQ